jgi:hypothetical protein
LAADLGIEAGQRRATFSLMPRLARHLLAVLLVFAFIGGPTVHLAQPALYSAPTTMADMPCDGMASMADAGQGTPMAPCKGLTPDCIKQMGCVADVGLPARLATAGDPVTFSKVAYWTTGSVMAGVVRQPEPLPPRTA